MTALVWQDVCRSSAPAHAALAASYFAVPTRDHPGCHPAIWRSDPASSVVFVYVAVGWDSVNLHLRHASLTSAVIVSCTTVVISVASTFSLLAGGFDDAGDIRRTPSRCQLTPRMPPSGRCLGVVLDPGERDPPGDCWRRRTLPAPSSSLLYIGDEHCTYFASRCDDDLSSSSLISLDAICIFFRCQLSAFSDDAKLFFFRCQLIV